MSDHRYSRPGRKDSCAVPCSFVSPAWWAPCAARRLTLAKSGFIETAACPHVGHCRHRIVYCESGGGMPPLRRGQGDIMGQDSQAVRSAFMSQAEYCRRLGSPFTASVCEALAAHLDMSTAAGRAIL